MQFRPRILLADDYVRILEKATAILCQRFEVVAAVTDGRAVLKAAEELHPDVIVLDITMPEMNGLEAAKELRRQGSSAKVIFLTVHQGEDLVAAALESGGNAFVLKSRMCSDLVEAIGRALAGETFISAKAI